LQDVDATGKTAIQIPGLAASYVIIEAVWPILREDEDIKDAGVDTIAEREIDDSVFPGKGDGGFGPLCREDAQTSSFASGQNYSTCFHRGALLGL
jgi:hypothetical protein